VARPVRDLARSVAMYVEGLGLAEIGRFTDHDGFDGVMLGRAGLDYHFEFTLCRAHPVAPVSTPEDLIVFYVPEAGEWHERCRSLLQAGFVEVRPFNPYWARRGRTFEDPDGYRVVLQQTTWEP
jgi:catechol 2,3-dioxygenase-like lactoylglutathione lyase family enzyme